MKVFLVDDHGMFRAGVRGELAERDGIEVVGEAGNVAAAIRGIRELRPDVVLLDVHMPDGGGVAVLEGIRDVDTKALALSVSDAAEDVIAVIRAGARGYVTKTVSGEELAAALARVHEGDAIFSPRLAGFVLDAFAESGAAGAGNEAAGAAAAGDDSAEVNSLTPREREVLKHLARGYSYREIAERLFISIKTVETHASSILRKTQHSNRHALTRWAHLRNLD